MNLYSVEWWYENKEESYKARDMNESSLLQLLRLLQADDENNRTYVAIHVSKFGSAVMTRVCLADYAFRYLREME